MNIGETVALTQTITAGLYNSVQILQRTSAELEQQVVSEINSNAVLEENPDYKDDREVDWDEFVKNYSGPDNGYCRKSTESTFDPVANIPQPGTKSDMDLTSQIECIQCSEAVRNAIDVIVMYCLDEHGFISLPIDNPDIAWGRFMNSYLCGVINMDMLPEDVQQAIICIRDLEPNGIGYRNRQESFIAQAECIPGFPREIIDVIKNNFDALEKLEFSRIAHKLNMTTQEATKFVTEWIKRLNPYPIPDVQSSAPAVYSYPELTVKIVNGREPCVKLNSFGHVSNRVRICKMYVDMLQDPHVDAATKSYIKTQLNKGKAFITNLKYRESTIEKLGKYIVRKQRAWFLTGNDADLVPMSAHQISIDLQLSDSTISRSVTGKFIDTPYGIFELKKFVASNTTFDDGNTSYKVIDRIGSIIGAEDKHAPLSDDAITQQLAAEGIKVSRRVVMKYREKFLHIKSSRDRRII